MFGLSRGAFLARSVAGMINNCGIVKPIRGEDGIIDDAETDLLCSQVYSIYRDSDDITRPHTEQSLRFRRNASWPLIGDEEDGQPRLRPPVKFMGLIDTVGSLGIPDFVGGVGLDWPQFHDQNVSSVVELVYHAMSIHDRFYIFPPCFAKRKTKTKGSDKDEPKNDELEKDKPENYGITQKWFPGVHYDLGRQRFRFLRPRGGSIIERLLAGWNWASREILPNEALSDLVLKWMLEAMKLNDPNGLVVPLSRYDEEIEAATQRMLSPNRQTGSGDVYQNILGYTPFGSVTLGLLTLLSGTRWQTNQIYQVLFAMRDRVIADLDSDVYNYEGVDASLVQGQGDGNGDGDSVTVGSLAAVRDERYPSKTFRAWGLKRRILGMDA